MVTIALPLEPHETPQPTAARPARFGTTIGTPKIQSIACIHADDIRGIQELSEVFRLPDSPRPRMMCQAVQIDQINPTAPAIERYRKRVVACDVEMAQIQILVETTTIMQHAGQPCHLGGQRAF